MELKGSVYIHHSVSLPSFLYPRTSELQTGFLKGWSWSPESRKYPPLLFLHSFLLQQIYVFYQKLHCYQGHYVICPSLEQLLKGLAILVETVSWAHDLTLSYICPDKVFSLMNTISVLQKFTQEVAIILFCWHVLGHPGWLLSYSYFPKTFIEHLLGARCFLGTENRVKLLIMQTTIQLVLLKKPLSGVFQ